MVTIAGPTLHTFHEKGVLWQKSGIIRGHTQIITGMIMKRSSSPEPGRVAVVPTLQGLGFRV